MTKFTIETTYRLPVYRRRTYDAETLADACRRAIADDDWDDAKKDYESSGATYVSGAWEGIDAAYRGPACAVSSEFGEDVQCKAGEPASHPDAAAALAFASVVCQLAVSRVRAQLTAILETDPDLSPLSADAVTDADIYDACVAAAAAMNLDEEIAAAEFRAALIAIGRAERRLANGAKGGSDHG